MQDFAGACGARLYCLIMAIRPEALPTDPATLTEMVLALDAENEKLRVAMQTLKEMIFGKRSERLAVVVAEQLALGLDDLEPSTTPPPPANDDQPAATPSGIAGRQRRKAARNIGALPKHLPRCEQVLEPDTTACPCCQGRLHRIGEDISEVLDVIPAILRVLRTIAQDAPNLHGRPAVLPVTAGGGHQLCAQSLGWADAVPRRRARGGRHQHGGAFNAPDRDDRFILHLLFKCLETLRSVFRNWVDTGDPFD